MAEKIVLGIYSITPVHPGSGSEVGVIDLPIQRERHTGFPVVWGQSLKGALRSAFPGKDDDPVKVSIFGPPTDKAHEHSGAVSVGDAKILLFPVRSVKGVFAYVTSPFVLERFKRDMELAGRGVKFSIPEVKEKALIDIGSVVKHNERVVLEEVALDVTERDLSDVERAIKPLLPDNVDLKKRLVIVPDDVFSAFVRLSTEIVARIRIDPEKGTVAKGALWYEEFLPSETLLYSVLLIDKPRGGALKSAEEVVEKLTGFIEERKYLQLGGDETVGKGFVLMRVWGGGSEPEKP